MAVYNGKVLILSSPKYVATNETIEAIGMALKDKGVATDDTPATEYSSKIELLDKPLEEVTVNWYVLGELVKTQVVHLLQGEVPIPPTVELPYDWMKFEGWDVEFDKSQEFNEICAIVENTSEDSHLIYEVTGYGRYVKLGIRNSPTVDWGDGTVDNLREHTYTTNGIVDIKISDAIVSNSGTEYLIGPISSNSLLKYCFLKNKDTVGLKFFQQTYGLKYVSLPKNITGITSDMFIGSGIQNLIIPNGVTIINSTAFKACTNLKNITIPDSVTTIKSNAFQNCYSLTNIKIPEGITTIDEFLFESCYSLNTILLPNSLTTIKSSAFQNCNSLKKIIIPENVINLNTNIFKGCSNLRKVIIPEGTLYIHNYDFTECYSLEFITIPDSVTSINRYAFSRCYSLKEIKIPESVTKIGEYAFNNCRSLTNITIPNNVTTIAMYAFIGCSNLKSIEIPEGVTSIGAYAFSDCINLKSIAIPEGIPYIGDSLFKNCNKLFEVTLPNSITTIYVEAFYNTGIFKIVIPESVTSIGQAAFLYCKNLIDVIVLGIPTLDKDVFNGTNSSLTIWVNDENLSTLQTMTNWTTYASKMRPLSEYTGTY